MKSSSLLRSAIIGIRKSIESATTFSPSNLIPQRQLTVLKTTTDNQLLRRQHFLQKQDAAVMSAEKSALLKQILGEQKKLNEIISSIQNLSVNHINQRVQKTVPEKVVEHTVIRFPDTMSGGLQVMNRNGRVPRRANHGKRPVCRAGRRHKRRSLGNHKR